MTIAAAYLTSEGVVLGGDSTTTISFPAQGGTPGVVVAQLLNHAQKVFEVGEKSRLGLCTYGSGSIKGVSHRTIAARLGDKIDQNVTTIENAALLLEQLVVDAYNQQGDSGLVGYYLGGWDPVSHVPECIHLVFDNKGKLQSKVKLRIGEATFSGSPDYFSRVFRGFDPRFPQLLFDELVKIKGLPEGFQNDFEKAFIGVAQQLTAVGFSDLPIREAIDYIHTYLHITIKAAKFRYGPQPVGGPIEIAFITTDRRFRWACHKSHSSAVFEQEAPRHE